MKPAGQAGLARLNLPSPAGKQEVRVDGTVDTMIMRYIFVEEIAAKLDQKVTVWPDEICRRCITGRRRCEYGCLVAENSNKIRI